METWGWDVVTVYKGAMCICQASGSRMGYTITLVCFLHRTKPSWRRGEISQLMRQGNSISFDFGLVWLRAVGFLEKYGSHST